MLQNMAPNVKGTKGGTIKTRATQDKGHRVCNSAHNKHIQITNIRETYKVVELRNSNFNLTDNFLKFIPAQNTQPRHSVKMQQHSCSVTPS